MTLAEEIAALHVRMVRAEDAGHQGECDWYRFEIRRLEDLRDSHLWCEHRRQLTKDLNRCNYAGDPDGAAVVEAAIQRWGTRPAMSFADQDDYDAIIADLGCVLKPSAFGRWMHVPIPALGGTTPDEMIQRGDIKALRVYVHSYLDESFS